MAKRFTDTDKWKDAWFTDLEPSMKVFWLYLCDNCDHAGIWKVNFKMASFVIGTVIDKGSATKALGERILILNEGHWLLQKFVSFQYGKLRDNNSVHVSVINTLRKFGLDPNFEIGYCNNPKSILARLSKKKKLDQFSMDYFRCTYCGINGDENTLVVDHIVARMNGGDNSDHNLTTACISCNSRKSHLPVSEFIERHGLEELISEKLKSKIALIKSLNGAINVLNGAQDKDKDKDMDKDTSLLSYSLKTSGAPKPDQIIQLFNETLAATQTGKIKFCAGLSADQSEKLLVTLSHKAFQSLETWKLIFENVKQSDWLIGLSSNFVVTLNWLVDHGNALKVLNGQYNGALKPSNRAKAAFSSKKGTGVAPTPQNPTGNPYTAERIARGEDIA